MSEQGVKSDKRENLRKGVYLLPNLITAGSLFAGFYVIIASTDGHFVRAAWFILLSAILDGLDGKVARMTGTTRSSAWNSIPWPTLSPSGLLPGC